MTAKGLVEHRSVAKTIWIDMDNSPHVPFFAPIIDELEGRGYAVCITARDCFQVKELAALLGVRCQMIGSHWGRNKVWKVVGTCARALQLTLSAQIARPCLAVSHGSRSQIAASRLMGIRSAMIDDYEGSRRVFDPDWLIVPEIIPDGAFQFNPGRVLRYPGIKEDVYTCKANPDAGLRAALGLTETDIVVTVRPPASDAHYHNPESDALYETLMTLLVGADDVRVVLLPRSGGQAQDARRQWGSAVENRKILIPDRAVDGLSLIWASDLVVSGGGTMNREAAAMGVPVYSFFRGTASAIDRYLAANGRLTMIASTEDIHQRVALKLRSRQWHGPAGVKPALKAIADHIAAISGSGRAA